MKKILFFLFSLLVFSITESQTHLTAPLVRNNPADNTYGTHIDSLGYGGLMAMYDTIGRNNIPIAQRKQGMIVVTNDSLAWQLQGGVSNTNWIQLNFSGIPNDTIYVKPPLYVYYDSLGRRVIAIQRANGLYSGGIVTQDSCFNLDVSSANYSINFFSYTSANTLLTVSIPDVSNPRIDLVYLDTTGQAKIRAGDAAATPSPPSYNPASEIPLAYIYVPTSASCLGAITKTIYDGISDDPTQWNVALDGTLTADTINTDWVFHLNQALFVSTYTDGSSITFTDAAEDTITSTTVFKGHISLNGALGTNNIQMQLFNTGTPVGNPITLLPYINPNDSNEYQLFQIRAGDFGVISGNIFNQYKLTFSGNDLSGAKGLYLDYIQLQNGITNSNYNGHGVANFVMNATNDSIVLTRDDGVIFTVPAGGGGGSQNLQQVTDIGNTTTNSVFAVNSSFLATNTINNSYSALGTDNTLGGYLNLHSASFESKLYADTITANRFLHLPDATGTLVATVNGVHPDNTGNITVSGATSPAGNYGNIQLNRNGVFSTPATDSLSFNSGTLTNFGSSVIKGTQTIITTATGTAGTDSILVQNNGLVKKISPTYYATGASGSWPLSSVLIQGNSTKQTMTFNDSTAGGTTFVTIKPRNYDSVYTGAGHAAAFQSNAYRSYYVNADGRPNVVGLLWGYNGGFGAPNIANEPSWGFRTETHYQIGAPSYSEFHLPEFVDSTGTIRRLMSFYVVNGGGYTNMNFHGDAYNLFQGATDTGQIISNTTQTIIGTNTNGAIELVNQRVPTRDWKVSMQDAGVNYVIVGGASPSGAYHTFTSPIAVSYSSTIGTGQGAAVAATVGTVFGAGLKVLQSGLTASNFVGLYAPSMNTTATFYPVYAFNTATGGVTEVFIGSRAKASIQYYDGATGASWYTYYNTSDIANKTWILALATDSLLKFNSGKHAFLKYDILIGSGTGNTGATAKLQIGAGTATANTAPLKFTTASSVILTTPETGVMEVDTSNIYYSSGIGANLTRYFVTKTLSATATLDFPSTASLGVQSLTITVTGAVSGDGVDIGVPNGSMTAGLVFTAWVSAANTVTIQCYNSTLGAIDPSSGTFRASVLKY